MGPVGEMNTRQTELLAALRKDRAFADAILVVGKDETPVHRAVLSVLSPFFRAIFQQCASSSQGLPRITLQHASEDSGGVLVDYAYGLDVSSSCSKSLDLALDVANLAATLSIPGLCEAGCRAALNLVESPNYPRLYYALRLFGRVDDALKCLSVMARDAEVWRDSKSIDRLAPPDLMALLKSPDIVATEDDILCALVGWVEVDPSSRQKVLNDSILPLLRAQRFTARSSVTLQKLARFISPPLLMQMFIGSNSRPTAIPTGGGVGSRAIAARAHGGSNRGKLLGASLDWMSAAGQAAFVSAPFQTYPVPIVSFQYYVLQLPNITPTSLSAGIERYFYVDFLSLCVRFRVILNEHELFLEPVIERRNRDDSIGSGKKRPSDLLKALGPLVIMFESAIAFQGDTPLQNAFSVWHAPKIAINAPNTTAPSANGIAKPNGVPPAKRQRTGSFRKMDLLGSERRTAVLKAIRSNEVSGLTLTLCMRSAKYSSLVSHGYIARDSSLLKVS